MSNTNPLPDMGNRFNEGKMRWSLFPFTAAAEIVKVLMFGAAKYGDHNWQKGLKFSETFESMQRHALAWWNGEDKDAETGYSHMAHVGCNALFLMWFIITGKGVDDRPSFNIKDKETIPAGALFPIPEGVELHDAIAIYEAGRNSVANASGTIGN